MDSPVTFAQLFGTVSLVAALQWLAGLVIAERLKTALKKEGDAALEALKWDLKVREQAAKMAEYLSLASSLKENDSAEDFRKANRLAWESAMWLPEEIYRDLRTAFQAPTDEVNHFTIVIKVRQLLLGNKAGSLTSEDVVVHGPGIGRPVAKQ